MTTSRQVVGETHGPCAEQKSAPETFTSSPAAANAGTPAAMTRAWAMRSRAYSLGQYATAISSPGDAMSIHTVPPPCLTR